jgi:hypothetical protein
MRNESKWEIRKPYHKPEIQQVRLVVEEAVLQACKTNASEAAGKNKNCDHPQCRQAGS